jgi:Ca-activated chloride channel family protein
LLLGVGLLCLATAPAAAQAQGLRFAARADRVLLSATAVDGKGRPVRDLEAREFKVYEEGQPQTLAHFSTAQDLPARILLLVDASGSMNEQGKTASVRMAVIQLLASLGPADQVALAGFDSKYFGVVPFTREREPVIAALDRVAPFGATALHDALEHAARDIASHGEGRRAVVVLSDGIDTASHQTADQALSRSVALEVPIYAVSVVSPLDDAASPLYVGKQVRGPAVEGEEVLRKYAGLSGGRAFAVSDFRGLKLAADQIAQELKHQYRLGYDPPEGPARFRRVEVRTTRKGVTVRTRSGYLPRS